MSNGIEDYEERRLATAGPISLVRTPSSSQAPSLPPPTTSVAPTSSSSVQATTSVAPTSSSLARPPRVPGFLLQHRRDFREFDFEVGPATMGPSFFVKSLEMKERLRRVAILSDQHITVLKPFGLSKILRLSPNLILRIANSAGEHLGRLGVDGFYTVYREGSATYIISDKDEKKVTRAKLLASYPFLWTILLLAWFYGLDEQFAEDTPSELPSELPDEVLQAYLCVWHDTVGYQSVARREAPVAISTLLEAPILPSTPPFEPPMVIWARQKDWDLVSASNRVSEKVQKRVRP